jgi:hypothetical protein
MKLNQEIQAIIALLQSYLGINKTIDKALFEEMDWQAFDKALIYHSLQPIAFQELQKAEIELPSFLLNKLTTFSQSQAISHLSNTIEIERLNKLFNENGIEMLTFKGVTYQKDFYKKGLRESGDIDVLVRPKQLKDSIQLLINDGYQFTLNFKVNNLDEICHGLMNAPEHYEFPFYKNNHHVDLHWGINYGFLPYQIPEDFLFGLKDNREQIFWTMLNHHGGKEFWLKLKNLLDFALFVEKYQDKLDWQSLHQQAKEFKMETVFLNGLYLLKNVLKSKIPPYLEGQLFNHSFRAITLTLKYWNGSRKWSNPYMRLKFERILMLSQDYGFSKKTYFTNFYKAYTKPNPAEQHRYITFPQRFHFLNFLSKVFSYLIKKTFGLK